jgi:hypothetical protein
MLYVRWGMLCLNIGSELKVKRKIDLAMTEYTCLLPHSSIIKYKMSILGRSRASAQR